MLIKQEEHTENYSIYNSDNLEVMPSIPDNSVDLIITSPPYADRRKNTYGGVSEDKYLEWFKNRVKYAVKSIRTHLKEIDYTGYDYNQEQMEGEYV